jgi:hypothetical protein
MDDGAKAGSGLFLHTDGFSKEDVVLLLSVLDSKFGLKCSLRQRHKISMLFIYLLIAKSNLLGSSRLLFILLCNTKEFRVA